MWLATCVTRGRCTPFPLSSFSTLFLTSHTQVSLKRKSGVQAQIIQTKVSNMATLIPHLSKSAVLERLIERMEDNMNLIKPVFWWNTKNGICWSGLFFFCLNIFYVSKNEIKKQKSWWERASGVVMTINRCLPYCFVCLNLYIISLMPQSIFILFFKCTTFFLYRFIFNTQTFLVSA